MTDEQQQVKTNKHVEQTAEHLYTAVKAVPDIVGKPGTLGVVLAMCKCLFAALDCKIAGGGSERNKSGARALFKIVAMLMAKCHVRDKNGQEFSSDRDRHVHQAPCSTDTSTLNLKKHETDRVKGKGS